MTPLSGFCAIFVLVAVVLILWLPRRWASVPLLVGASYLTLSQGLQVGPFNLFAIRLLLLAGIVRVLVRHERIGGGLNGLDKLIIAWAIWAVFSSVFHDDPLKTLKFNSGIAFNACGCYFLVRALCTSLDDAVELCAITVLLLVPVSIEMYFEHLTVHNSFSALGGVSAEPAIREGRVRAQGPFAHAILAGTVGAVCLPLAIALWKSHRRTAMLGACACVVMIITSASSGPAASSSFAVCALLMWCLRERMRMVRWAAISTWIGLSLAMNAPAYYLIARIDVAGGSTGWYRARLVQSAIEHFDEWWLGGTDYTRHWMGTSLDETHADITNHYIYMGVTGGILLLILFVLILATAFRYVGMAWRSLPEGGARPLRFFVWALGASLFAHTATFISVSYFDQSFVFLYLTLATIASIGPRPQLRVDEGLSAPARDAAPELDPRRIVPTAPPKRTDLANLSSACK